MANTANETGREGLVGEATSQVQDAASTAQEKAVELKEQGQSRLGEKLDQRTNAGRRAGTQDGAGASPERRAAARAG